LLSGGEFVIPIYEFKAYADQSAPVVRSELRVLSIDLIEQITDSCTLSNLNVHVVPADEIAQMCVKSNSQFHCAIAHGHSNVVMSGANNL
jgi:hypothetical protein